MAEPIVTYRGTVYPWHCDHMGHMNVMWYVGKFDEATWQLFSSIGLPPKRLRNEGIGMVAVEQRVEYKQELVAGDLVPKVRAAGISDDTVHDILVNNSRRWLAFVPKKPRGTANL